MKTKFIYPLVASVVLLGAACRGDGGAKASQQQYESVQEGSAAGVTSTIHGPGEIVPPLTGTNADTTTAFTLNQNPVPTTAAPPGSVAGTFPPPQQSPTAVPSGTYTPQVTRATPVTRSRPVTSQPVSQQPPAEQQPPQQQPPTETVDPLPPPTDTTATQQQPPPPTQTTTTPPPAEKPKKEQKQQEEEDEGEETDTAPPPPPPPA